jgi:hypothetical protein
MGSATLTGGELGALGQLKAARSSHHAIVHVLTLAMLMLLTLTGLPKARVARLVDLAMSNLTGKVITPPAGSLP